MSAETDMSAGQAGAGRAQAAERRGTREQHDAHTVTTETVVAAEKTVAQRGPGMWALVREDVRVNGGWGRPGAKAMVMYRLGVWRMGLKLSVLRMPLSVVYRWMHKRVRNHYGIELHWTAKVGRRLVIGHQHGIVIHEYAKIGDDCVIRQGVTIGSAAGYSDESAPELGNKVDVGAGAKILGKVKIGDGARIGPNAVVLTDVAAGATAFAPPARVVQLKAGGGGSCAQG